MAWYPAAITTVSGKSAGQYVAGAPWRIVWHTTELRTAQAGINAWRRSDSWPHFQVDENDVYQFVDTDLPSRALKNARGGVETNRLHAVQIELVGRARDPRPVRQLIRAGLLARWIEQTHSVLQTWPAGLPPANAVAQPWMQKPKVWTKQGGHYGHCHVPENDHGDPGYLDMNILLAPESDLKALETMLTVASGVSHTAQSIRSSLSKPASVLAKTFGL